MPGFFWDRAPVIVPTVGISDWRSQKFLQIQVVQGRELNRYVIAANLFNMSALEWPNTAGFAK
jgi:hypothetical protein